MSVASGPQDILCTFHVSTNCITDTQVFQTGLLAHLLSCTRGNGSFMGVQRPVRGADRLIPSKAEVKERVDL
jgi:hypothetical protein